MGVPPNQSKSYIYIFDMIFHSQPSILGYPHRKKASYLLRMIAGIAVMLGDVSTHVGTLGVSLQVG